MRSGARRGTPLALAAIVVLAACGGSDGDAALPAADAAGEVTTDQATDSEAAADTAFDPATLAATQVDLLGVDVRPESEFAENLLPSVVLDDVSTGRKVNFRNLVPQDKPILLWMYAPH